MSIEDDREEWREFMKAFIARINPPEKMYDGSITATEVFHHVASAVARAEQAEAKLCRITTLHADALELATQAMAERNVLAKALYEYHRECPGVDELPRADCRHETDECKACWLAWARDEAQKSGG